MSRSCPPARRSSRRRLALTALTAALAAAALPASAHAADLLVLQGEQATLSGGADYGIVYVDGELRLAGDTTITAGSVYIGPNAYLRTCFVPGAGSGGSDTCTAGRSLTIRSSSTLTIEPGLDLTGRSGTARPGGSLVLSGGDVAVGGAITTAGNGAGSGSVAIDARGTATTGAITAYGAPVTINAARHVSVNGDIRAEGVAQVPAPAGRLQPGAPVSVSSSGGDVAVRGNITTYGRDAGAGQGAGGNGAAVALSGGDVRVGAVDTTGGNSADIDAGVSGPISLAARGSLHALGRLEASGATATTSFTPAAATVSAAAGGPVALAGGVGVSGGNGVVGGAAGGIDVSGASVTAGTINATGGTSTSAALPYDGAPGGTVSVRSAGNVSLGAVFAGGGSSQAGAHGGSGGSVSVRGASVSVGQVGTGGGATNGGPGAGGGPITLDADGGLSIGGTLSSSGSSAAGNEPLGGGSAGRLFLRAAGGTLDLGAPVWATGGRGGQSPTTGVKGGPGGNGGDVALIARSLGTVVSVVAEGGDGGDYGDDQGPGGAGGAIHGFTDGPLLDDLKVVSADGGDGRPTGASGARTVESSPTGLAISPTGTLSWASRSPGASRFRILRAVAGGPSEVLTETGATSTAIAAPLCKPVTLTVVAVYDGVRFTSDRPAAVAYTPQPSATQKCGDPAAVAAAKAQTRRLSELRKAKWSFRVPLTSTGVGHVDAVLQKGKKKVIRLATAAVDVKPGPLTLKLTLPKGQRRAAHLTLGATTTSPDGSRRAKTTVIVDVRNDAKSTKKPKGKSKTKRNGARR